MNSTKAGSAWPSVQKSKPEFTTTPRTDSMSEKDPDNNAGPMRKIIESILQPVNGCHMLQAEPPGIVALLMFRHARRRQYMSNLIVTRRFLLAYLVFGISYLVAVVFIYQGKYPLLSIGVVSAIIGFSCYSVYYVYEKFTDRFEKEDKQTFSWVEKEVERREAKRSSSGKSA